MKHPGLITFLTDFGQRDEYVGVMKGVVASIAPKARVIDISHGIEPGDIVAAGRMIMACYRYFPNKTIHVMIVDPGVGSGRAAIAIQAAGQCFLGPDNGLLGPIIERERDVEIRRIERSDLFLSPVSHTFHGRDIFAPVAAHLTHGVPFESLGSRMAPGEIVQRPAAVPVTIGPDEIAGVVVGIDRFGNLISNIDADRLWTWLAGRSPQSVRVKVNDFDIQGISNCYADQTMGGPVALIGSRNDLEIAVSGASAHEKLKAGIRTPIRITAPRTP